MRDHYIYKVLTLDQWRLFQQDALFKGSPVDLADGFIHLSCANQLIVTLNKWYSNQSQVALLQVDASKIDADLKYEISRGGAEFPHLFADLPMSAINKRWLASPNNGAYRLPDDLHAN